MNTIIVASLRNLPVTDKVLWLVMIALTSVLMILVSRKMFQILQLSSYRARGMINWLKITRFDYQIRYFALAFLSAIATYVYVACFYGYKSVRYLGFLIFVLFAILFVVLTRREKEKVPVKYTARMIRLNALTFIIYFALGLCMWLIAHAFDGMMYAPQYALLALMPIFAPWVVMLAHYMILPLETLNNYTYKVRAKNRLSSMPEMIRIGITGSYGKTTAKVMLAKMLEKKYRVSYSQKSYNTPMGICKVINNFLPDDAQVFIAEMGARYVGDIAELAKIVEPNYGLITAIGNQHLETFGSIENIMDTKYELIENLTLGGLALFNGDSERTRALYDKASGMKVITGAEGTEGANIFYKNVEQDDEGVNFTLCLAGGEYVVRTKLLGRHVPSLMTLCAALAFELGVSAEDIVSVCESMEPVPHRLELIKNGENMIIIDDAYNANVEGAQNALNALSGFVESKKAIITPGLVELGKEEKQANIDLGAQIGEVCDLAMLIGERAPFLKEGALSAGMSEENIHICASLDEAVAKLRTVEGRVAVLFENDLPDNF